MNANLRHARQIGVFLAVIVSLLAMMQRSRAQVVAFDNLGSAPYYTYGYSTFGFYSDGNQYARGMQFTPSQTIKLSTLELAFGEAYFPSGDSAQSGTAQVQLMTDNNNAPGTVLESWTSTAVSGFPANGGVQTFTSLMTPTLAAGSNYWIVLSDASGSGLSGAWFFADDQHTGNTLTMWVNQNTGATTFTELTRGFRTQVDGIAVVAPSLSIARTATNTIVVSWPTSAAGWVLESTNSITASAPWPQLPPPYPSIGTNFFVTFTNNPAAGNQFFRLHNP